MNKDSKILIVGHNDVMEQSLLAYFKNNQYAHVISSSDIQLNTTIQPAVYQLFQDQRPDYVFLGSVRSGGIQANLDSPADFLYANSESQNNIIYAAQKFGTKKLLYYGSSCVYPKDSVQPIKEEYLMTGTVEASSSAYAAAKIAGIKLCQAYRKQYGFNAIVAIPATVYGPQSDLDEKQSHVIGALIGKFHAAVKNGQKQVQVWGTGEARREFLFVDDFLSASLFLMEKYDQSEVVNMGVSQDITIKELAQTVAQVCGYQGTITFDASKPEGVKQKLLDSSRINQLGWKSRVSLKEGIQKVIDRF